MKVTLPSGVVLEAQSAEEIELILARFSQSQRPVEQANGTARRSSKWPVAGVRALFEGLGNSKKLLDELVDAPPKGLTTREIASNLDMADARGIGAMIATVRRHASTHKLPTSPVISENDAQGERRLRLADGFREAAEEARK
jgi:hypothetical protein